MSSRYGSSSSRRSSSRSRKRVEARDREIERLGQELEGGRPFDVVSTEAKNRSNERLISHLNMQVDYLQEANKDLENRLKEVLADKHAATSEVLNLSMKNEDLVSEMKDIDILSQKLHTDKEVVITAADREVREAQVELRRSNREVEAYEVEVDKLKTERKHLLMDKEELGKEVASNQQEVLRLQDLLEKVQEDKRRLSDKVSKLVANEKELVMELERIQRRGGVHHHDRSPPKQESMLRSVEEERDFYRGEVETLRKMLKSKSAASSPVRSRGRSPKKGTPKTATPSKSPPKNKTSAHYETIMRVLEDERDFYKREYEAMKALRSRALSPSRAALREQVDDAAEMVHLRRERDELQALLGKYERNMAEANSEVQRLRKELLRSPKKSSHASLAAQSMLRRLENERDEAIADLRRTTTERDSLRERLRTSTETHLSERARLDQRIEDLENVLQEVQKERTDLQVKATSMRDMIGTLEDQVRAQHLKITEANEEASQFKATSTQMRLLAEQAEHSLNDSQRRLQRKAGDLHATEEKALRLEEKIGELQEVNALNKEEVIRLRATLASLDKDKDLLQMTVDEKAEALAMLEKELAVKERQLTDLHMTAQDLEAKLVNTGDDLSQRDRELRSQRRQLDSLGEEASEAQRGREAAARENRRLQEDLATMTRENQTVNQEYEEVVEERENLKVQIQEYVSEVARVEEMLSAKDQEMRDLLENYRLVTTEAERWETEAVQREGESSAVKLEVMAKENDLRRLKERVGQQDNEIQQHLRAQQAYEMQLSSLSKSLSHSEDSSRHLQQEKEELLKDQAAVRELCSKLDNTKESLSRQLTSKSIDYEQTQHLLEDMKRETEMLRHQVSSEREAVRNLEGLLSTEREKEFQVHLENQEQRSEIQLLKDKLALSDSKNQSQQREIQTMRTRTTQLEEDMEKVRRQLTGERFERERAGQELRRHGLTPPPSFDASGRASRSSFQGGSPSRRSLSPSRRTLSPDRSQRRLSDRYRSSSPDRSLNQSARSISFLEGNGTSGVVSPLKLSGRDGKVKPQSSDK